MSLSLLKKQLNIDDKDASTAHNAVTRPGVSRGRGRGSGSSGAGYNSTTDAGNSTERSGGSGGYYGTGGAAASRSTGGRGRGSGNSGYGPESEGGFNIAYPKPTGGFRGSSAQAAHIEAIRKQAAEASKDAAPETDSIAVKSGLGLQALQERQRREAEDKQAKRDAARAKRMNETTKKEADDEAALAECESQAKRDCEEHDDVKYEAALVVRIACNFGSSSAWMKIAEARARGANIPLDPRRVYLLAHPDKCRLPEASDATAILNAQRPPEMTEVKAKAPSAAVSKPAATAEAPVDPEAEAEHRAYLARQQARAERLTKQQAGAAPAPTSASTASAPAAARPTAATASADATDEERRVDPEDGKLCTLEEMKVKYAGVYTPPEIEEYFNQECKKPQRRVRKF